MKRFLAVLLGAVLVLSGTAGSTSQAADSWPPPVITSTGNHNVDTIPLTATSDAPYVLFRLSNDDRTGPFVQREPVAAGPSGTFADSLPAAGLNSHSYATAVNCQTSEAASCDTETRPAVTVYHTTPVQLSISDNPHQVLEPTVVDGQVQVPAAIGDESPWLVAFGARVMPLRQVEQGTHNFDISALSDGDYRLWLQRCSTLVPEVCDDAHYGDWYQLPLLSVRRAPRPSPIADGNTFDSVLNPNGDGFADVARYLVRPDAVPLTSGTWRLLDSDGKTAIGPRSLSSAVLAGDQKLVIDPRAEGRRLSNGRHTLKLTVGGTISGVFRTSIITRRVDVWNSPSLLGLRTNLATVYPVQDGYRDTIYVGPTFRLPYAAWMKVIRADGTVVRTNKPPIIREWNGTSDRGHLVPEGRYRFAYRLVSPNYEAKTFQTPFFTISHKRLVTKTFRKTVTAKASLLRNQSQRCGRLRPEPSGAVHYLSRFCRPFIGEGSRATGLHQVRLPAGDPVSVRVGATGRSLDRWGDDEGKLINLTRSGGRRVWTIVGPGHGTWFTHALRPPHLFRSDRRLHWLFETHLGREFRVRTFTVVYRYRVLQ